MTTELRVGLSCVCLLVACALKAPPEPAPIVCEEIERAEERFPEECSDAGAEEAPEPDAEAGVASDEQALR